MTYSRPPFPRSLYAKFCDLASTLGYEKRGEKWRVLAFFLQAAETYPELFKYLNMYALSSVVRKAALYEALRSEVLDKAQLDKKEGLYALKLTPEIYNIMRLRTNEDDIKIVDLPSRKR